MSKPMAALPDHSSLPRVPRRRGATVFCGIFSPLGRHCQQAGMVSAEALRIDTSLTAVPGWPRGVHLKQPSSALSVRHPASGTAAPSGYGWTRRSRCRASSLTAPTRSLSRGWTRKHLQPLPSRSSGALWVPRQSCPTVSSTSRRIRKSLRLPQIGPMTRAAAQTIAFRSAHAAIAPGDHAKPLVAITRWSCVETKLHCVKLLGQHLVVRDVAERLPSGTAIPRPERQMRM